MSHNRLAIIKSTLAELEKFKPGVIQYGREAALKWCVERIERLQDQLTAAETVMVEREIEIARLEAMRDLSKPPLESRRHSPRAVPPIQVGRDVPLFRCRNRRASMCRECYQEYGEPTMVTPEIQRVANLVNELYEMPHGGVGGNCHIVTDDWNLEDSSIEFCLERIATGGNEYCRDAAQQKIERELLDLMGDMTEGQRAAALGLARGYFTVDGEGK